METSNTCLREQREALKFLRLHRGALRKALRKQCGKWRRRQIQGIAGSGSRACIRGFSGSSEIVPFLLECNLPYLLDRSAGSS